MLILPSAALPGYAQPQREAEPVRVAADERFAEVRARIIDLVEQGEIPSMAIAVAQEGEIIWEEAFGWADLENQVQATPQTVYPVGSLSKSMMATGVMTLVEQGALALDDPVLPLLAPASLPDYTGGAEEIAVWHLLNMAAGIPHGWMVLSQEAHIPADTEAKNAFLEYIGKVVFPPGTFYHYSNYSIGLAEWLVERVSGRDFAEYMRGEFFLPLGMHHTGVRVAEDFAPHLARRYSARLEPLGPEGYTVAPGGLGFFSSAHDLIRYGLFNLKNPLPDQQPILGEALLDQLHYFDQGPDTLFALGWFTGDHLVSNGSVGGANSRLTLVPAHDLALVCLTNMTSPVSIADQICDEITAVLVPGTKARWKALYERYMEVYEPPYAPTPALLGTWAGRVETPEGEQPLTLVFAPDSSIHVTLGEQDTVALEDAVFSVFSFLEGHFPGTLQTHPWQPPGERDIRLYLLLNEGRLFGYASAPFSSERGGFSVPVYVSLERR